MTNIFVLLLLRASHSALVLLFIFCGILYHGEYRLNACLPLQIAYPESPKEETEGNSPTLGKHLP